MKEETNKAESLHFTWWQHVIPAHVTSLVMGR